MYEVEKQTEQQSNPVEVASPTMVSPATGPTRSKPPGWMRVFLLAGSILLGLGVVLTGTLLALSHRQPPARQATPVSQPTVTAQSTVNDQPLRVTRVLQPSTLKPIPVQTSQSHTSQITVAGGVAYVGSSTQTFYALRVSDGSVLWAAELTGSATVPPVVSGGVVYVTTFVGYAGPAYLFALRASDGKQLWHTNIQSQPWGSLVIDQGIIYAPSQDGVAALQASDGKQLWDRPVKENTSVTRISSVVNGLVYVSALTNGDTGPGTLYALRASDGSVAWSYTDPSGIDAPVVIDGVVYSSSSDTLLAFRADTGAILWKRPFDGFPVMSSLQSENGTLYLLIQKMILPTPGGQASSALSPFAALGPLLWANAQAEPAIPHKEIHSTVYALDSRNGSVRWSYAFQGQDGASWMILDHGMIYSSASDWRSNGTGTGYIFALDSADGKLLWNDQAQPSIDLSTAQLAGGVLYITAGDGSTTMTVYALRSGDGTPLWSYPINAAYAGSTALSDGTLYLGPSGGIIYALRASDGRLLWHYQTKLWG